MAYKPGTKPSPRWSASTAAVLMVLFFVVWMLLGYSFRPNSGKEKFRAPKIKRDASAATETTIGQHDAAAPAPVLPSPPPSATCSVFGSLGMTWTVQLHDAAHNADLVGCSGAPAIPQRGTDCNAIHGDTSCSSSLPILCINKLKLPRPENLPPCAEAGKCGWSGGNLALTPALQGCLMTSSSKGDELCATYAGAGFVMAGFHDAKANGGNGWGFYGHSHLFNATAPSRFWVSIGDQKANCWNPRAAIN